MARYVARMGRRRTHIDRKARRKETTRKIIHESR
jgi:hypothetical protein